MTVKFEYFVENEFKVAELPDEIYDIKQFPSEYQSSSGTKVKTNLIHLIMNIELPESMAITKLTPILHDISSSKDSYINGALFLKENLAPIIGLIKVLEITKEDPLILYKLEFYGTIDYLTRFSKAKASYRTVSFESPVKQVIDDVAKEVEKMRRTVSFF